MQLGIRVVVRADAEPSLAESAWLEGVDSAKDVTSRIQIGVTYNDD